MNNSNLLFSLPPRVMSRIIALVLALLIAFAGAKVLNSVWVPTENPPSNDNGENADGEETENTGGDDVNESSAHFSVEGALSVATAINGESAVLCVLEDKTVIAEKNLHGAVNLKESTLFMVALTVAKAISEGRVALTDEAVCPASAAKSKGYALSSQILPIGKRMRVGDILKCMFYQNGTSYACTLAVHISGSEEAFVQEMNDYAKELSLENTHFANCTGDEDGNSSVSAYDFAVILKQVMSDVYLRGILCSDDTVTVGYGTGDGISLMIKNVFFERWCTPLQAKNDGIIGGRVGSEWSCVLFSKNGKTYLAIVLKSEEPFTNSLMLYSAYGSAVQ